MKIDDILKNYISEFGNYQKIQFLLVCLPTIFPYLHAFSWTFTGAALPHRCVIVGESAENFTTLNEHFFIWNSSDKFDQICQRLAIDFSDSPNKTEIDQQFRVEPCLDGYKWDNSQIKSSATQRWEFVCDRSWLRAFMQSIYSFGQLLGSMVFGILADKFGRKPVFFVAIFTELISGTILSIVPFWQLFAVFRFLLGLAHPGIFVVAVVLGAELVGPKRRVLASCNPGAMFSLGAAILGGLAWMIRDYQRLQLALSLPALIFVAYYWIVPESARWLHSQGRHEEAERVLKLMAKWNGRILPDDCYNYLDNEKPRNAMDTGVLSRKYNVTDMFRTKNMRKRSIICLFCWPAVSMSYYGLSMNPTFMGGNVYVSFIAGGLMEMAIIVAVMLTLNQTGRRKWTSCGFFAASLCLISTLFIPDNLSAFRLICVMFGKMLLNAIYAVLYIFTSELFPTVLRSTVVGTCSMVARIGDISAAYLTLWLAQRYPPIVAIVFSIVCVLAAILAYFLPETNNQPQADYVEEIENVARPFELKPVDVKT